MFGGTRSDSLRITESEKLVLTIAGGIALGYIASLFAMFFNHAWILDAHGRPIVDDFVAFWAAGHQALNGAALATYDAQRQHAAEVATIGQGFSGTLGWSYPPVFLFVAAALASLPFANAFAAWCATTLALYAGVVAAIARRPGAFVIACAAPWVLTALMPGQNGFLTAGLVGAALLLLEEHPALAGLILGLLGYKPQFGVLFPLALAAGGYWRAFAWAAISAIACNGIACAVFGFCTLGAFIHALSGTTQSHLANAGLGWNKLQSLYGLMRAAGAAGSIAWAMQAAASILAGMAVVAAWRARLPFPLKAALLASLAPLATPYVLVYDLPVLAVAVAFLFRHRNFDRVELGLLAITVPAVFAFMWMPMPSAFFASLAVAAIAARRCYSAMPRTRIKPSCATDATSVPSSA